MGPKTLNSVVTSSNKHKHKHTVVNSRTTRTKPEPSKLKIDNLNAKSDPSNEKHLTKIS